MPSLAHEQVHEFPFERLELDDERFRLVERSVELGSNRSLYRLVLVDSLLLVRLAWGESRRTSSQEWANPALQDEWFVYSLLFRFPSESDLIPTPGRTAFSTMMVSLLIIIGWTATQGIDALLYIPHHFPQLISAALAMSLFQACFVYAQSYMGEQMLATGGNSSNPLYNVLSLIHI